MTEQRHQDIQYLIPDILPLGHVSLSAKRIRFVRGQGIILYNDTYAVELYIPRSSDEQPVFFGVQRHFGKIKDLGEYFKKLKVQQYDDPSTTQAMKMQFDEALFQYEPLNCSDDKWIIPSHSSEQNEVSETIEVYMRGSLSGAA